ncbi:PREDICTED: 2-hydroxyacylsphingosine 1-beta-galactosyltransferase-like [Papilio polytes]|uniref:2-hydroxyacylsphingosine 1-beta-galactosyltransferase-like n=1 Tax=Papilio polytes TaxID=76194 RepID=UPI0006765D13|nr:PREDICTED: 2-hydroxyacylsphingosine 1-beta-galactosyltransferase-like [Papilio polytes]
MKKMLVNRISFFISLLVLIASSDGLRVLVFFPMMSKSHSILGQGVVSRLLEAGHEVVHVTSYPRSKPEPRLKEIDVSVLGERLRDQMKKSASDNPFALRNLVGKGNIGDSILFLYFTYDLHRQVLEEKIVVDLLSDTNEHFDAVIIEWFFNDVAAGIAPLFECPLIWFGSTEAHWQILQIVDEIPNPAYNVDIFSINRSPLTFWQRTMELWMILKKSLIMNLVVVPFERLLYKNVFPPIASKRGVVVPSYDEAIYNASLLFLNSHPSIGTSFRLPQNAKYVAGYHINKKVDPLPKDLQKLMDSATHGVIYFSMGSNLQSADMSDAMKDSLIKMFGQLKQTIIWKFEQDLPNVPSNVHLVKWAPQASILSHPNLKMFITHGGQLSTTEAIHFGVPVVGIPVMADQHVNMRSVEIKGFGILVKLAEDMAPKVKIAIEKVLQNPYYKQRAKEVSQIFHDRILPPGEELVHWVEYVVRTRGATHLRSPALGVPLYQKLYLDFLIVLIPLMYLLVKCINVIRRKYSSYKSNKLKKN